MINRKAVLQAVNSLTACLTDAEAELQQKDNLIASQGQTIQGQAKTIAELRAEIEKWKQEAKAVSEQLSNDDLDKLFEKRKI